MFHSVLRLSVSASLLFYTSASIISATDARLPMSMSTVISDLEAEGCQELTTACLITSRGVTREQRAALQDSLFGTKSSAEEEHAAGSCKAVGTNNGIVFAQPQSSTEVASTVMACGGTLVYYPSNVDLSRGEGLFDYLAPAMEQILAMDGDSQATLIVVGEGDLDVVKARLNAAADAVLANLVAPKTVAVLEDVFAKVIYISPAQAATALTTQIGQAIAPTDASSRLAAIVSAKGSTWVTPINGQLSAIDLAAARTLGPAARVQLTKTVEQVTNACQDDDGSFVLIPNFGDLCDAAIDQALDELQTKVQDSPSILMSNIGRQIQGSLRSQLSAELGQLFDKQVALLQQASFEDFKKGLSKLLISPNLEKDMKEVASKSLTSFAKAVKKLVAQQSDWDTQSVKSAFHLKLNEHCANRLLSARASGQFKPLPRKGVTVGLHWLLPKPFGNDFRQEPWMVHATDNMVYVPKDKITEVSPVEVQSGDWREKIIPSPVGNDMIYMQ